MKIKDITQTAPSGAATQLADRISRTYWNFLLNMDKLSPCEMIMSYKSLFSTYDEEWSSNIIHEIKHGRRASHILLRSVGAFKLDDFIRDRFGYKLYHNNNFNYISYTRDKFHELALMETAMLFAKYKPVYDFEVRLAILEVLLQYFTCYETDIYGKDAWTFTSDDIQSVTEYILNADAVILQPYLDSISKKIGQVKVTVPHRNKPEKYKYVPKSKEELLEVIDEGMTNQAKCEAIMDAWPEIKSYRSAQRLLQKYGLTRKYTKQESIISDNIEELRAEIQELRAENERLRSLLRERENANIIPMYPP